MRIYHIDNEEPLKNLGEIDISGIREEIFKFFNPEDEKFRTIEYVFGNTYRIVGELGAYEKPQKYSIADRSPELTEICRPLINWLHTRYENHVPVLIQCATVPPKTELKWHMDTYQYQNVSHKVHFPIISNKDATYQVFRNGTVSKFHFEPGQAYEINNILPHRVVNAGDSHRIHVIIDFMPKEALDRFNNEQIEYYHELNVVNKSLERQILAQMMYHGIEENLSEPNKAEKKKIIQNYFRNPTFASKYGIMGEAESRLYYSISSFSGAICIVPFENPSKDVIRKFVKDIQGRGFKDIYFLDNANMRDCLELYDIYKVDRISKGNLSNLEEINEYLLCYVPVEQDTLVMKATLKKNVGTN